MVPLLYSDLYILSHIPPAYPLPYLLCPITYRPFRAGETLYKILFHYCQHKKAKKLKNFSLFLNHLKFRDFLCRIAAVKITSIVFFFLTFMRHNDYNILNHVFLQGSKNVKKQYISFIFGFNPFGLRKRASESDGFGWRCDSSGLCFFSGCSAK